MANTYTQMNVHAVFSVKGRGNFISKKWQDELLRYIAGTLKETNNYTLSVGTLTGKKQQQIYFRLKVADL